MHTASYLHEPDVFATELAARGFGEISQGGLSKAQHKYQVVVIG